MLDRQEPRMKRGLEAGCCAEGGLGGQVSLEMGHALRAVNNERPKQWWMDLTLCSRAYQEADSIVTIMCCVHQSPGRFVGLFL